MPDECPMTGRDCDIDVIAQNTARHSGYWKVVFLAMSIFITIMIGFAVKMHEAQQHISISANKIDKALSTYIAASEQKSQNLELRIQQESSRVDDHETRIRILEKNR